MEEYEVRDVSFRADVPNLSLQLFFKSNLVNIEFEKDEELSKPVTLYSVITNEAVVPAIYYIIRLYFDKRLIVIHNSDYSDFEFGSEQILRIADAEFITNLYYRNYSAPLDMPVWQGIRFRVAEPPFQIAVPKVDKDMIYILGWSIDSPGMQQKIGRAFFTISNNQARLDY